MILERLDVETCGDHFAVIQHRNIYDFVLARLTPDQQVLEIGTGLGAFSKELLPKCRSYVGIEYDGETCVKARLKTDGLAQIIQADARKLPFADNQFSFIVCLEVLEHIGEWQAGLKNIHRCLQPEGMAIISVPYRLIGGKSKTNEYHVYEPGKGELISVLNRLFSKVEVYYQFFEEAWWMTLARWFRVRRFVGLSQLYADLSAGQLHALSRIHISQRPKGWKLGVVVVASGKKSQNDF